MSNIEISIEVYICMQLHAYIDFMSLIMLNLLKCMTMND